MGMAEPAEAATPVASSSSTLRTSPAKYGSLANSTGPSLPTTVAEREKRHSRRPSRAERYESVIATARETLRRATGGYDDADLQVGPASDPLLAERRRRSKRLSSASFEPLPERDWRETVRSLLSVVDGMVSHKCVLFCVAAQADMLSPQSQQLASHDELATELKIAQSNLSLASAHSEFLEETLRRRESRNSASHLMARQHSTGESLPSLNSQSRRGSADVASPESGGAGGLFGLGLSTEADAGGAKSFFRLPSKRKSPNPAAPAPSAQQSMESGGMQFARRLRSVGSSPALNKGFFSSEPAPPLPLPPRESTSTVSSTDFPSSPVPADEVGITTPLAAEVFALRAQVSSLETECTALRSTNASLKRNSETLVAKCAELEKTKDDLLSELENLSVELFSEANALVRGTVQMFAHRRCILTRFTLSRSPRKDELAPRRRKRSNGSTRGSQASQAISTRSGSTGPKGRRHLPRTRRRQGLLRLPLYSPSSTRTSRSPLHRSLRRPPQPKHLAIGRNRSRLSRRRRRGAGSPSVAARARSQAQTVRRLCRRRRR